MASPRLEKDSNTQQVVQLPTADVETSTVDTSISSATALNFQDDTKLYEVTAIDDGVYFKQETTADATNVAKTNGNFDGYVLSGQTRHYVRKNGQTGISFVDAADSGTIIVIEYS